MKSIFGYLIAICLTFNPLVAMSQSAGADQLPSQAAGFEKSFQNVIYSIKTLPDVMKDLDFVDTASGAAISKSVAKTVYERFSTGVMLMSSIYSDTSIPEQKRADMSLDLASALGEVLFTVIRHQGEDKIKIDTQLSSVGKATAILREFVLDARSLVVPQKSANGEWVWGPMERLNRDHLGRQAIDQLAAFGRDVLPQLDAANKLRKAHQGFWSEDVLAKMVQIREARVGAQKTTSFVYMGLALVALLMPVIDVVGVFNGLSEYSQLVSSIMYFSGWIAIGLLKLMTISKRTIALLKDTIEFMKGKDPILEADRTGSRSLNEKIKAATETFAPAGSRRSGGGMCGALFG